MTNKLFLTFIFNLCILNSSSFAGIKSSMTFKMDPVDGSFYARYNHLSPGMIQLEESSNERAVSRNIQRIYSAAHNNYKDLVYQQCGNSGGQYNVTSTEELSIKCTNGVPVKKRVPQKMILELRDTYFKAGILNIPLHESDINNVVRNALLRSGSVQLVTEEVFTVAEAANDPSFSETEVIETPLRPRKDIVLPAPSVQTQAPAAPQSPEVMRLNPIEATASNAPAVGNISLSAPTSEAKVTADLQTTPAAPQANPVDPNENAGTVAAAADIVERDNQQAAPTEQTSAGVSQAEFTLADVTHIAPSEQVERVPGDTSFTASDGISLENVTHIAPNAVPSPAEKLEVIAPASSERVAPLENKVLTGLAPVESDNVVVLPQPEPVQVQTLTEAEKEENFLKDICRDAIDKNIVSKFDRCMNDLKSDYRDVPGMQRDIALFDLEERLRKEFIQKMKDRCNVMEDAREREACSSKLAQSHNEQKAYLLSMTEAKYDIIERKMEQIDENLDDELAKLIAESCPAKPIRRGQVINSRDYSRQLRKYTDCERKLTEEHRKTRLASIEGSLRGVSTDSDEILQILNECGERPLIFGVSSYETCVDRISLENENRRRQEAIEEPPVEPRTELVENPVIPEEPNFLVGEEKALGVLGNPAGINVPVDRTTAAVEEEQGATGTNANLNCEDELEKAIFSLLQEDKNNILGKQFQKTSLKIALEVMNNRSSKKIQTIEDFLKRDQKALLKADDQNVLKKMQEFYKLHGKNDDIEYVKSQFSTLKNSRYWNKDRRLDNESVSAYLLADAVSNSDSRFSELDVATAWFAHQANSVFRKGTREANLTNMSGLVYRQLGIIKGSDNTKKEKIEKVLSEIDEELNVALSSMKAEVEKSLGQCLDKGIFNGSECWSTDTFDKGLLNTISGLSSKILQDKKFQVSMDKELRGDIAGKFEFNFRPR